MTAVKALLLYVVILVTANQYATMAAAKSGHNDVLREICILIVALAFILSLLFLILYKETKYKRAMVLVALGMGYVVVIATAVGLALKPELYSTGSWWTITLFFSLPALCSAWFVALRDEKQYQPA
jgi:hypothetical protein